MIIILFAIWFAFSAWRTFNLPGLSEPEEFIPEDHPVSIGKTELRHNFHPSSKSDTGITVY